MKNTLIYLISTCLMCACSTQSEQQEEETNVIRLKEALANPIELKLSEIVDSIAYIPLETNSECYVRETGTIFYSTLIPQHYYKIFFLST